MTSSQQRIQVLYEISLSIGATGELSDTARTALSAYLRKLNCSAGAVFERRTEGGTPSYETVAMIPSRAAISDGFKSALERIPQECDDSEFRASLPITGETDGPVTYYIMSLPEFGVLVLVTRKQQLGSETLAALGPLNGKLATACRGDRYEAQLRQERDRFETVFATIDEPLVSVRPDDGELEVQQINPAFETTFGVGETAALGRPLRTLLGPEPTDGDELPDLDQTPVTTNLRRETTDGMGEFLFRSTPFSTAEPGSEHLVLLVNITEAATRQRQLERYHEVTKALSRILRHNIRNDLTVIRAKAERIRDSTDGAQSRDAETIIRKGEQLASTAEKAREMRELVTTYEDRTSVALQTALDNAVSSCRERYPDADISMVPAVPPDVAVHPAIGVAVRHLVENGVEHQQPDAASSAAVVVDVDSTPERTAISVSDNGTGIPDTEISMVDRPGETKLEHGSGAGLWIVGQIIEYCDASLEFSTSEDGTTATITLED